MPQAMQQNIIKRIVYTLVGATLVSAFLLVNLKGAIAVEKHVDTASVIVNTTCSMTANVNTVHSATVANGTYTQNIGQTTIKTFCNDPSGYAIYAIGFSGDEYGSTDLIGAGLDASYNIKTGTATNGNNGDVSNWAMMIGAVAGTYAPTVENGFGAFKAVPSEYTKVASFNDITDAQATTNIGSSITTTYAAYVANAQPAGTYTGQVKYALVHPSGAKVPNPSSPKLIFDANGGTFAGGATTNVLEYSELEVTSYTQDTKTTSTTDTVDASGNHKTGIEDPLQYADYADYYQDITLNTDAPAPYDLTIYYATELDYDYICVFDGTSYTPSDEDECTHASSVAPSTNTGSLTKGNAITGPTDETDLTEYEAIATFKLSNKTARIYFVSDDFDDYHSYGFWAEFTGGGDVVTQNLLSGTYIDKPADRSGYVFLGWATTPNATTPDYTYDSNAIVEENTTVYAVWKNCNGIGTSIASITYMQQFDYICMANSMITGTAYALKDNRDSTTYHVSKLADGKIWMLDNLALDLTDSTVLNGLTDANTNASSTSLTSLRSGNRSAGDQYATAGVSDWTSPYSYSAPLVNMTNKNVVPTDALSTAGGWKVGGYYNYCAASAGSYCYGNGTSEDTSSGHATEDICPKGWRMPTGYTGEYQALYTAYSSDYTNFRNAFHLPLSGYINNGSAHYQGSGGYFWSSTRYSDYSMYYLYADTSDIDSDYSDRRHGNSVRCVAGPQQPQPEVPEEESGTPM